MCTLFVGEIEIMIGGVKNASLGYDGLTSDAVLRDTVRLTNLLDHTLTHDRTPSPVTVQLPRLPYTTRSRPVPSRLHLHPIQPPPSSFSPQSR